jgi:hypothetical protein
VWANKLRVSVIALAIGLKENGIIEDATFKLISAARANSDLKTDPELEGLTGKSLDRKRTLLERGLSQSYVSLCFDAIAESVITNARAAEMLLVEEVELLDLAEMFHVKISVHD